MSSNSGHPGKAGMPTMTAGAIGVVFGDIGTSPLYAMKECFSGPHGATLEATSIYGVLSMVFWAIALVVTLKYVTFILRADNRGEGGILALLSLVLSATARFPRLHLVLALLGIFGTALFYGDAIITPAISVLSAVEGVSVVAPVLEHLVVPITIGVLVGLFLIQRHGTGKVGNLFAPVMIVWFLVMGVLGAQAIAQYPGILAAADPRYALSFILAHPLGAFLVMGAVVLAVTGTEALYADMGHFGRLPIRLAWLLVVWPSLVLNYFGQAALLINVPGAIENPFFLLAPEAFRIALIVLATAATVIASQATISGAFSLTQQAMQLGYLPRMQIVHTSARERGQIYIPLINTIMLVAVVLLVIQFGSSSNLASAYGMAVTGAMLIDSLMVCVLMLLAWRWRRLPVFLLAGIFLTVDGSFLAANSLKIPSGGWLPMALALALFTLLTTWRRGQLLMAEREDHKAVSRADFIKTISPGIARVPGTAVFMSNRRHATPGSLLHNLSHNKVLHERVIFLEVATVDVPTVPDERRVHVKELGDNFFSVAIHYGFIQEPDVPAALVQCEKQGLAIDMMATTFFFARETLIPGKVPGMALWRERIFAWMKKSSESAMAYYKLPPNRVVELGTQTEI